MAGTGAQTARQFSKSMCQVTTNECTDNTATAARRRAPVLLFIFGLWAIVVCLRMFQVMILDRDEYLARMTAMSWQQDTIPAMRGRLLDRAGRPLAWSTRHFKLEWKIPPARNFYAQSKLIRDTLQISRQAFPDDVAGKTVITLIPDIEPGEFSRASRLAATIEEVRLVSYFKRHRIATTKLRNRLGDTVLRDRMEVGISGAELAHDSLLRGRPGLFKIMRNPAGKWLPETWQKIRSVKPGYDVYLPFEVDDDHTIN